MKVILDGMLLTKCLSGVEGSILNLARALARHGTESYGFCVPAVFRSDTLDSPRFAVIPSHLPVRWRPVRAAWQQLVLPRTAIHEGADLIHSAGYVGPLRSRLPVVITVYDTIALCFPQWCRPSNVLHYGYFLRRSARTAAGIIVPSSCTAEDVLNRLGVSPDRIEIIPLGVSEVFRPLEAKTVPPGLRARLSPHGRFLLFVGQQEPKKNLSALVRALHMLKTGGKLTHKLVVAGAPGWRWRSLRRLVRDLGLGSEVIFTGHVPQTELVQLYNAADLFVFPSLYEGFGLPPLEAMACGTPVVCSGSGALPEVVGDAAVVIDSTGPDTIAAGIVSGLEREDLRRSLIDKGLRRAKMYSWRKTALATEEFYRKVQP